MTHSSSGCAMLPSMRDYSGLAVQPSETEVAALTGELVLRPHTAPADSSVTRMVEWLRVERHKGGAELVGFHIGEHPVFDWFATRRRLHTSSVIEAVLAHQEVRDSLPHFRINNPIKYDEKTGRPPRGWDLVWPFQVPGEWATYLDAGGFQVNPDQFSPSEREGRGVAAMDTAMATYKALTGNRYLPTVSAYRSSDPWCEWFPGLFNGTWIVFDLEFRLLWLLAITDTD